MTDYERKTEILRLSAKLNLWDTPGFFQFIHDLGELKGPECDIVKDIRVLKSLYDKRMKELTSNSNNFKQGELNYDPES